MLRAIRRRYKYGVSQRPAILSCCTSATCKWRHHQIHLYPSYCFLFASSVSDFCILLILSCLGRKSTSLQAYLFLVRIFWFLLRFWFCKWTYTVYEGCFWRLVCAVFQCFRAFCLLTHYISHLARPSSFAFCLCYSSSLCNYDTCTNTVDRYDTIR